MSFILRLLALALALCMIATLFAAAEPIGHQTWFPPPYLDKVAHLGYYGLIAMLIDRGFAFRAWWPAVLITATFGALDEWHQYYVPNRSCDLMDWLTDLAAAILAVVVSRWLLARWMGRGSTQHT
jgi:VanZ family protein